jgi:hypothetical protein
VRGSLDCTGKSSCHMRLQCVGAEKLYNPLSSFCCIEVSFCCSAVFHIVAINWQIFDHVEKGENRNPYTVTTRVKVFLCSDWRFRVNKCDQVLRKFSWLVLRLV